MMKMEYPKEEYKITAFIPEIKGRCETVNDYMLNNT